MTENENTVEVDQTATNRLNDFLYAVETGLSALKICKNGIADLDDGQGAALNMQGIIIQMEKECSDVQDFLNNNWIW